MSTIWCSFPIYAQQIGVTPIKIEQQLPSLMVNNTFQDKEGYIWFATADGFSRFDAFNLHTFQLQEADGTIAPNQHILTINESNSKLLLGAEIGLYLLDKRNYRVTPFPDNDLKGKRIGAILVDNQARIWVGTNGAIYVYNQDLSRHATYEHKPGDERSIPNGTANTIYQDQQGDIWAAIWGTGLQKLDTKTNRFISFPSIGSQNNPFKIMQDDRGQFWIATWGDGLFLFNPDDHENMYQSVPIKNKRRNIGNEDLVYQVVQDRTKKHIWVLSFSGMSTFHYAEDGSIQELDFSHLFENTSNIFQDIYEDKTGTLWLTIGGKGISTISFDKPLMKTYEMQQVQQTYHIAPNINMLYRDQNNQLWFNLERIGFGKFSPQQKSLQTYSNLRYKDIHSLRAVSCASNIANALWVGAAYEPIIHVFHQNGDDISLQHTIDLSQQVAHAAIPSILFEDKEQNIWIGTQNGLLFRDQANRTFLRIEDINDHIVAITQDDQGHIWVATKDSGIYQLDHQTEQKPVVSDHIGKTTRGLGTNQIEAMDADKKGNLWIGTKDNRLIAFHTAEKTAEAYIDSDLLSANQILHLVCLDHSIWLSSTRNIYKVSPAERHVFEYNASDGIPINMFTKGGFTADKANNSVYFAGNNGIVQFWESSFVPSHSSSVVISDIKINNQSAVLNPFSEKYDFQKSSLLLNPADQNLEILFSSLEYTHPNKIRYAYKLEGVDKDWIDAPRGRLFATYNNLNKGDYTFLIKATDLDNQWHTEVTKLHIRKKPAFYESNLAYIIYTFCILGLIYAIVRFTLNRLKLRSDLRIAQIEKEKTSELVQTKLGYFTNISHELLTPLTIISCLIDDAQIITRKNLSQFDKMRFNLDRLKRLLQQILDFKRVENQQMALRIRQHEIPAFITNICSVYFSPLAKHKNINFDIYPDDAQDEGYFDADKVDKIIFNLLSNAFKYTPSGGHVQLRFSTVTRKDGTHLVIQVQDTGVGIAPEEIQKIFIPFYNNKHAKQGETNGIGLALTKELVELHRGSIRVDSVLAEGSTFSVELPIGRTAYAAQDLHQLHDSFIGSTSLAEEPHVSTVSEVSSETCPKNDINILLVEDNEDLLQTVANVLSRNYTVVTAAQGEEALSTLRKQHVDIVISDLMMPVMDGLTLCRQIKADKEINHIPVILLTAKNSMDDRIDCYQAGADSYISKPFDLKVLEARIHNFVRNKRNKQEDFKNNPQINISSLEYTPQDEQFIDRMITIVEEHLANDHLDVVVLGRELGLSKSTLYRKTKALLDLSPSEFIKNIRLKHACQMMEKDQSISVSEVAFTTGFSDPRYFSTCFKAEFGITPSEFQKNAGKG